MRQPIRELIDATLAALKAQNTVMYDALPAYSVEVPKNPAHGDWSCNVAMTLVKSNPGKKSVELADALIAGLVDRSGVVASVERAGPGFLNFRLRDHVFQAVPNTVLSAGAEYGRLPARSTGKRILVEFVSANPTGPVHIGHARGAFLGDGIARLLRAAGHDVTCEFYINDFGNQVEILGRTLIKRYLQLHGVAVELSEGEYPAEYVVELARMLRDEVGDRYVNAPDTERIPVATALAIRENLKRIRATLEQAGIVHDAFFSEQSLHHSGKVREIVDVYSARGVTYEASHGRRKAKGEKVRSQDSKASQFVDRQLGGTFLMTATWTDDAGQQPLKDDEDRIILRHDGSPVYLTADLAYHKDKFERGYDLIVNVFGADHAGHVPRIESGMALLGFDVRRLSFALVQIVRITRGGQEVKVSKRKGTVFELSDLIEEAGADVCRFMFMMRTRDSQIDFDLDLVKRQSRDNPVFYLQYGHARCANLLRKAEERGQPFVGLAGLRPEHLACLTHAEEKAMLRKISCLPDVVANGAERLEPHQVLYFCQELIADFHSYYSQTKSDPIINDDRNKTQGRLALVAALKQTLQSAFAILGISAPDDMQSPPDDA
jgi:arginyl-tRNA synthetase